MALKRFSRGPENMEFGTLAIETTFLLKIKGLVSVFMQKIGEGN